MCFPILHASVPPAMHLHLPRPASVLCAAFVAAPASCLYSRGVPVLVPQRDKFVFSV